MGFYGGVIVDVNAWDFAFNAVVGVDQPQSGPVVGVALDVAASQNWPNDCLRSSSDLQFERISSRLSVVIIKASL